LFCCARFSDALTPKNGVVRGEYAVREYDDDISNYSRSVDDPHRCD